MLAVHPKYWRRGHGTSLLLRAAQIADEDRICLGVASVPMAIKILERVKFEKKDEIEVEAYSKESGSFTAWIGVRPAQGQARWGIWWPFSGIWRISAK
jgi:ribosomal protein S18 acetylase RimI-like enzyme